MGRDVKTWQTISALELGRHSHHQAYAALLLSGSFEEAGDRGRFSVETGDAILHDSFEAHTDRFSSSKTVVVNLPLPSGHFRPGAVKVSDPDLIAKLAATNPREAGEVLLSMVQHIQPSQGDWPDTLARELLEDPSLPLGSWAEHNNLAAWVVTRGFARVFDATPESFRWRARTLRAWKMLQTTDRPLVEIGLEVGFADQAHMTRCVKQVTGASPNAWRRCK
jgi:AraC-like DNA-binding protein